MASVVDRAASTRHMENDLKSSNPRTILTYPRINMIPKIRGLQVEYNAFLGLAGAGGGSKYGSEVSAVLCFLVCRKWTPTITKTSRVVKNPRI
jgi:hypothetical protein